MGPVFETHPLFQMSSRYLLQKLRSWFYSNL